MAEKKFWFVVGSQHLYGDDAFRQVKENAKEIVKGLNDSGRMPFEIVFHDQLAVKADIITEIVKEINYRDDVAGVITWMHTFSPAKMWIRGTQLLQKPLLHLATQYNRSIPWETIDMDFMNLNQAAHGDREYGYINARLKKNNKIVVGYWQDKAVQTQIAEWMDVANAYNESFNVRCCRFGDNMRDVAVTDGDKIEAQIKFGWTVDYYGIGELAETIMGVSDAEADELFAEYCKLYTPEYGDNQKDHWEASVKYQAKIEIALKKFLSERGYNCFCTNFEDLHDLDQLPGLAVQRLMAEGYGFGAEGDWKTSCLDRMLKVMAHNDSTGFTEDYTYELAEGKEAVLESHMLEVDPCFSADEKPILSVHPLGIGGKAEPARLRFKGKTVPGIALSVADFGDNFKVFVNEIEAKDPGKDAPNLPTARMYWEPKPNLIDGVHTWIEEGAGHHAVCSLSLNSQQILDWIKMVGAVPVLIK